jgi:hypothetical protein
MSRTAALHRGFGVAAIAKAFCASRKRASGIPTFRCADTAKVVGRRDLAHDLTIRSIAHVVWYRPPEMRWESEPAGGPLTLSYELRPGGNRPGPADLWAQFNVAVERLGASLAEGRAGVCGHGRASLGSDEPRHSSPPPSARVPTRHGRRRVCSRSRPHEARHCAISYFIAAGLDWKQISTWPVMVTCARPGTATATCCPAARRRPRHASMRSCSRRSRLWHALWRTASETQKPPWIRGFRSTATGIRTRVSAVRGRRPSPLDDSGGVTFAGPEPSALPRRSAGGRHRVSHSPSSPATVRTRAAPQSRERVDDGPRCASARHQPRQPFCYRLCTQRLW